MGKDIKYNTKKSPRKFTTPKHFHHSATIWRGVPPRRSLLVLVTKESNHWVLGKQLIFKGNQSPWSILYRGAYNYYGGMHAIRDLRTASKSSIRDKNHLSRPFILSNPWKESSQPSLSIHRYPTGGAQEKKETGLHLILFFHLLSTYK
jgi:hypothetical protein